MTRHHYTDHAILARIVALLLSLADLGEHVAHRSLAMRLFVLSTLLPAHNAVLILLDIPTDADREDCEETRTPSEIELTSKDLLLRLAVSLRAIAALMMHVALNASAKSPVSRQAITLTDGLAAHPVPWRDWIGVLHDTS